MFGLLNSIADLATDVVDIAKAPVEMAADLVGAVTAPLADAANELVKDVKSLKD